MTLKEKVQQTFISKYGAEPLLIESPGRVNLMGDHTDYNDGFVLPAAIQKVIWMGMAPSKLGKIRAFSVDMNESVVLDINDLQKSDKHWANYIKGVVSELAESGYSVSGFDVVFGGDIPIGAGLSSSAALEGAVVVGLDHLFDLGVDRKQMAKIGQLTEHNHVGLNCGIMDQFINLHGEANSALKLDCRSLEYQLFPFEREDIKLVLCNSKVSHNLASSEYNVRRGQCEKGVAILKQYEPDLKNLRDVTFNLLEEHKEELGELVYRRCRFVLEENKRVHDACRHLQENDFKAFGERMYESHAGLSSDYEVSCEELDILVDLAKEQPGVFGSRMMGGGFGGCTINLVQEDQVGTFTNAVSKGYKDATGVDADIYITQINAGAKVIEGES